MNDIIFEDVENNVALDDVEDLSNNVTLEDSSEDNVMLDEPEEIVIRLDNRLNIIVTHQHDELENLDYEVAGHTGFATSRLSLMQDVSSDVSNERLIIMANVDNVTSKISMADLKNRITKNVDGELPLNLQTGQYILKKIGN